MGRSEARTIAANRQKWKDSTKALCANSHIVEVPQVDLWEEFTFTKAVRRVQEAFKVARRPSERQNRDKSF